MKAALIGYGYWGKILRRYIEDCDSFELVGIYSENYNSANGMQFFDSFDEILYSDEIEVVFVCTPIGSHYEICKKLLENKKHVFCEKPTTKRLDELVTLTKIAKERNKILFTDYVYLMSRSINQMKKQMIMLGQVCRIEGEISQFGNFYPDDTVYEIIGVHLLSVIAFLYANAVIKLQRVQEHCKLSLYDGNIELLINDSIQVSLKSNLISPKKTRIIKVFGTEGSLLLNMMDEEATLRFVGYCIDGEGKCRRKEEKSWKYDECNNLRCVLNQFAEIIANKNNEENYRISLKVDELLEMINERKYGRDQI